MTQPKKKILSVWATPDCEDRLENLRNQIGAADQSEVAKTAYALLADVAPDLMAGARLVVERPDGSRREVGARAVPA